MKLYNQVLSKSTLLFNAALCGAVVADRYSILKDKES
jgi:hypothetical protein